MEGAAVLDVSVDLQPEPGAAGSARRWAGQVLTAPAGRASKGQDLQDTVELVLTELVQNAVLHAGSPMTVRLRAGSDGVRVEVTDRSPVLPSSGLTDAEAMSGRGLLMVAAVATAWGAEPVADGKVVWAEIPRHQAAGTGDDVTVQDLLDLWSPAEDTPLQAGDAPPLVVRDLPSGTMLAVKTHNDDVLRELTLVAMSDDADSDVRGLAQRARQILASFADGRQQVRNQVLTAVHEGAATFDLTLAVGGRVLAVLADYLDVLEQAEDWAVRGLLLTEPASPDVLSVRRHYLTQLLALLRHG